MEVFGSGPGRPHTRAMSDKLLEYHQRSKHRIDRYAPGPGGLDWANQPDPFRAFHGAAQIKLRLLADSLVTRYNDVRRGALPSPRPVDIDSVAILFELALGLSAWKSLRGTRWALRCNPSSGNLHPTEGYLVCPRLPRLTAGVYHYLSRDHALEQRAAVTDRQFNRASLIVVGSVVRVKRGITAAMGCFARLWPGLRAGADA